MSFSIYRGAGDGCLTGRCHAGCGAWTLRRLRRRLAQLPGEQCAQARAAIADLGDILRRNGLPPSPQRQGLTWGQFLARHADALLCVGMFAKKVWTCFGLKTAYVLFALHLRTRRIVLAEADRRGRGARQDQFL